MRALPVEFDGGGDAESGGEPLSGSVPPEPSSVAVLVGVAEVVCEEAVRLSVRWSAGVARPSARRPFWRSNVRTLEAVARPYWPSAEVRRPTFVRYFCSCRTSLPVDPTFSVRVA